MISSVWSGLVVKVRAKIPDTRVGGRNCCMKYVFPADVDTGTMDLSFLLCVVNFGLPADGNIQSAMDIIITRNLPTHLIFFDKQTIL